MRRRGLDLQSARLRLRASLKGAHASLALGLPPARAMFDSVRPSPVKAACPSQLRPFVRQSFYSSGKQQLAPPLSTPPAIGSASDTEQRSAPAARPQQSHTTSSLLVLASLSRSC